MRTILKISLLIILILYIIFLSKYLLFEEILVIYSIPALIFTIVATLCFLLIRIFISIKYKKILAVFFIISCLFQLAIMGLILKSATPHVFSNEQIISDIDYAVKTLENVHPNPYKVISKENFYLKVDSIKKKLPEKISETEALKIFFELYALVRDAHTGSNFSRIPIVFRKTLPYKLAIRDERIFVAHNYSYRGTIPVGSEIIEINEKSSQQCLREISHLVSWETIPWRNVMLQNQIIWSLWNDFRSFKIVYKTPEGRIKTIHTSGGLWSKISPNLKIKTGSKPFKQASLYGYKTISDSIGYMEFNSFSDLDQFNFFLDTTFTTIKKSEYGNNNWYGNRRFNGFLW
jgi:hypothetical protein